MIIWYELEFLFLKIKQSVKSLPQQSTKKPLVQKPAELWWKCLCRKDRLAVLGFPELKEESSCTAHQLERATAAAAGVDGGPSCAWHHIHGKMHPRSPERERGIDGQWPNMAMQWEQQHSILSGFGKAWYYLCMSIHWWRRWIKDAKQGKDLQVIDGNGWHWVKDFVLPSLASPEPERTLCTWEVGKHIRSPVLFFVP